MELREIPFEGPGYAEMLELRNRILRRPLGLELGEDERQRDAAAFLLGCYDGGKLVGCLLLEKSNQEWVKMRQVAVSEDMQGRGVGAQLLEGAYDVARKWGYENMYCHARMTASDFYLKHGWLPVGDEFDEQGIPHKRMEAPLIDRRTGVA